MKDNYKHPRQPLIVGTDGEPRFHANKIVRDLLSFAQARGFGMNEILEGDYCRHDRVQFAQLIGYSLNRFGELSYVSEADCAAAEAGDDSADHAQTDHRPR